ncbi:MAG: hypothetical protein P8171_19000 [Candidatus Thiodiazotropha sp.]
MIKTVTIIVFLSLVIAFNAYADDTDRINQLEKEVQELKLRISKLESLLNKPNAAQEVVNSSEGYKSIVNWRKLTTDMGYSEVREILGEPQRVDGGSIAEWYYPNGGKVIFQMNKAWQWREPRE